MSEDGRVTADARFLRGVAFFNQADFFEAHEDWEALWHDTQGPSRDFIQGLIQVTSAMHHLQIGNMRGARQLHDSAVELLTPYGARHEGVDLLGLFREFNDALREILSEPMDRLAGRTNPSGPVRITYTPSRAFQFPFTKG
jgi:predicted metal-dependent hydrolase